MRLKWLGHSAFLMTAADGTRIITDPYQTRPGFTYGRITETADVVTISHDHADHNYLGDITGHPVIVRGSGTKEASGIRFRGIASQHDDTDGQRRGGNTIFCFTVDGINVCHLGDLGHQLTPEQVTQIGPVNLLLIPVGGNYTIDAATATEVCARLGPNVTIPMHYKTPKLDFPITGVEPFLDGKSPLLRLGLSEIEVTPETLPRLAGTVVLGAAL